MLSARLPLRAPQLPRRASFAPRAACAALRFAGSVSMGKSAALRSFRLFPADSLFVSEPPPEWFGNPPNEKSNASWTNGNWLKSRFHFNFAEHSGGRASFGVLRVCNDDLVQPSRGFGTHPHRDAEIATYIVSGQLTHKDSTGTSETLGRGGVQFMTAGTGVRHSEHNRNGGAPLRFIQLWFSPRASGLPPRYGSCAGDAAARRDKWAHLVGDVADASRSPPVKFNADANIFVTELGAGSKLPFALQAGRQAYVLQLEGDAAVSGAHGEATLAQHDGAELVGPSELSFKAGAKGAHVLLIEMAASA